VGRPGSDDVRDEAAAVVGWRYWQLSGAGLLRSVTQKWIEWPPGQPMRARCLEVNHPAPDPDCNCGIYGTADFEGLKEHGLCLFPDVALVVGQVALWGTVVGDGGGYRGELGYPVRLSVVVDTVAGGGIDGVTAGLARYGVPVEHTALDDAVAGASATMLRFQAMSLRASRTWGEG
jgi:hypothetical protein